MSSNIQISGFRPKQHQICHTLAILRLKSTLQHEQIVLLWDGLASAGIAEQRQLIDSSTDEQFNYPPMRLFTFQWTPPDDTDQLILQQKSLQQLALKYGVESAWFFQVNTEIDSHFKDEENHGKNDKIKIWKNGPAPQEKILTCPLEGYPEIIDEFDWYDFGIAVKLGDEYLAGEEGMLYAFLQFWLTPYIDNGELIPFRNSDVHYDKANRSALIWVDRFTTLVEPEEFVHHLIWVVAKLNEVIVIRHARFGGAEIGSKFNALTGDDSPYFVLAGNPFAALWTENNPQAAQDWVNSQSDWSHQELAEMYLEVMYRYSPDENKEALTALALCRQALVLAPEHIHAKGYQAQLLVQLAKVDEALTEARKYKDLELLIYTIEIIADKTPGEIPKALKMIPEFSQNQNIDSSLVLKVVKIAAKHAPQYLTNMLDLLPQDSTVVKDFAIANELLAIAIQHAGTQIGLTIYNFILLHPIPAQGSAREAYLRSLNNACILAHAIENYSRAVEIADQAQSVAKENPHIFHSAACAYAAVKDYDTAFKQTQLAIEYNYEHLDKMRKDSDLGEMLNWPRFKALWVDRKNDRR